jgi:hypothetical protein
MEYSVAVIYHVHTKFHKDWLRHSKGDGGGGLHGQQRLYHKRTFIFLKDEMRLANRFIE